MNGAQLFLANSILENSKIDLGQNVDHTNSAETIQIFAITFGFIILKQDSEVVLMLQGLYFRCFNFISADRGSH